MNVREIAKAYLEENGYDSLFNPDEGCSCTIRGDGTPLMTCNSGCVDECIAGVLHDCATCGKGDECTSENRYDGCVTEEAFSTERIPDASFLFEEPKPPPPSFNAMDLFYSRDSADIFTKRLTKALERFKGTANGVETRLAVKETIEREINLFWRDGKLSKKFRVEVGGDKNDVNVDFLPPLEEGK